MLRTIVLEVRDRATFLPVLATELTNGSWQETKLVHRCGYDVRESQVVVTTLETMEAYYDRYKAVNSRTLFNAIGYIQDHFDELKEGDIIDVEFILGETDTKKKSDVGGCT